MLNFILKKIMFIVTMISFFVLSFTIYSIANKIPYINKYEPTETKLPFIRNKGQVNQAVKYYTHTEKATIFVDCNGNIGYVLASAFLNKCHVVLEKINSPCMVKGLKSSQLSSSIQYYIGNSLDNQIKGVSAFKSLDLGEVCKGISVCLNVKGNNVEKVIKLDPHAEVENLQIKVNGANDLSLTKNGELKISTNTAPLIFTKPVAYQLIDRKRQYVHVTYCITEDGYSFRVGEYDKRHELIIDPLLTSAVVSGSDKDIAEAIATDCCGNVYIGAGSRSSDFPVTPGVFDRNLNGSTDALVLKFDSTLQKLISATFLGGSSLDYIYALDISDSGSVFVAGYTKSDDIPTNSNAYDRTFNGSSSDGFIAKLDSGLKEIQACTYLGGSNHWYDTIFALTVDDKGDVYVAGDTRASDFPVLARSHDNSYNGGETDGFIAKLDGNLSTLKASTFLGGSEADFIYCMQMDRAKENIYVAGKSTSPDLPATPGAFETIYADDDDGFVAKFDKGLTGLKNLTYLNGQSDGEDEVYAIALDHANSIYVLGDTSSSDFPRTSGVYETEYKGSGDVFVTKLSSGLKEVLASTLLGGEQDDKAFGLAIDPWGGVCVTGWTYNPYGGENFPVTQDAFDKSFSGASKDAFFSRFDSTLSSLIYSTLLGGSGLEEAHALTINRLGDVIVTGYTESIDFPSTKEDYQTVSTKSSREDLFITGFDITKADAVPVPKIMVNNSDYILTISKLQESSISISLNAGARNAQNADWWIVAYNPPNGFKSLVIEPEIKWVPGIERLLDYQLFSFPYLRLQGPEFSIGTNYLIFAVDENADGYLDATWWDYVEVNVK